MWNGAKSAPRVAVLISAGGSTLQTLLEMQHQFTISLVVSNRRAALGLLKARRFGVPTKYFSRSETFETLSAELKEKKINYIFLAGFMKILPASFVQEWSGRILNIHPSLLPAYKGLEAAEKSWVGGSDMGVTIHHVTEEMDAGERVLQMISLQQAKRLDLNEALLFLRRTEQHLLRQVSLI